MKEVRKDGESPVKLKRQIKSKSSYEKYRCQYKQKSILTKLNSDSGYPQQILQLRGNSVPCSNYVQNNKSNLKNFFKDRVPPQNDLVNQLMKLQRDMIHPKRIFQIKQLQYELKSKTKMNMKNSFQEHISANPKEEIDKINSNFHIHDKTREVKQRFGGHRGISKFYQTDNFRRGTKSHIEKRSKVLKKEAYDKVFGPDISSLSRTTDFKPRKSKEEIGYSPNYSIHLPKTTNFEENSTHQNLRALIFKMHDYRNKLQESNQPLKIGSSEVMKVDGQQDMVTLIQNMARLYQERTILQGIDKMQHLEDISRLNKTFYEQMLLHKNNRLSKRRQFALNTISLSPQSPRKDSLFQSFYTQRLQADLQSQLSIQDNEQQQANRQVSHQYILNAVKYRFKLLKRTLVRWAALFHIYGIRKENIFSAFKTHRDPYHLQGSYAFFKCIKMGDITSVTVFLNNNHEYAFQIDLNGRTPISYAACHNKTEIASVILQVGVNSDRKCNGGHTALFYALEKGNVDLVRQLLHKGACPWSSEENNYSELVQNIGDPRLDVLMRNARKVYLGMQIQSTIALRKKYWSENYHRIVEKKKILYER